jgi:amino acid permease
MEADYPKKEVMRSDQVSEHSQGEGSTFGAYFNIVCVVAGTGILGLSFALKQSGWVGLILFFLVAIMAAYTGRLLIECLYVRPNERLEEFYSIGEEAFGNFGKYFVKTFHYIITLSSGCIYILLAGKNLDVLTKGYGLPLTERHWIIIAGAVSFPPVALLKTMKEVAWASALGTICTVVMVLVIIVGSFIDLSSVKDVQHQIFNGPELPLALTTIAFSYGGNVVYPHVEASMARPKQWNKALFSAMLTITTMYLLVAIIGYYVYGTNVESPILYGITQGANTIVGLVAVTIHVIMATPVYVCSFCLEVENNLKIDTRHMSRIREFVIRFAFRGGIIVLLTVVAMFVPYFSILMSLIGAIGNCMVIFIIPLTCHYKLFGWRHRPWYELVLGVLIIIVAIFGLVMGSIDSVRALINAIKEGK